MKVKYELCIANDAIYLVKDTILAPDYIVEHSYKIKDYHKDNKKIQKCLEQLYEVLDKLGDK